MAQNKNQLKFPENDPRCGRETFRGSSGMEPVVPATVTNWGDLIRTLEDERNVLTLLRKRQLTFGAQKTSNPEGHHIQGQRRFRPAGLTAHHHGKFKGPPSPSRGAPGQIPEHFRTLGKGRSPKEAKPGGRCSKLPSRPNGGGPRP